MELTALDIAEEKISELENIVKGTMQSEAQRERKRLKKAKGSSVTISSSDNTKQSSILVTGIQRG